MTIAALITHGIGPGGSVKYVMTGGLDIGAFLSPWTPITPDSQTWNTQTADSQVWTPITPDTQVWT